MFAHDINNPPWYPQQPYSAPSPPTPTAEQFERLIAVLTQLVVTVGDRPPVKACTCP